MDNLEQFMAQIFARAGLDAVVSVKSLGAGGLNNSYLVKTDHDQYCVRVAKYDGAENLMREADALVRLPEGIGPKRVFFDATMAVAGKCWIIEEYLEGETPVRLTLAQFEALGRQLARVHAVAAPDHDIVKPGEVTGDKRDMWKYVVFGCRSFYNEHQLLHDLPDKQLEKIMRRAEAWFASRKQDNPIPEAKQLLYRDATMSNLLVVDDEVRLIDWEFRDFGDPMSDFSTGFWDTIDFNQGKWRIVLNADEKSRLYRGYETAGGVINEERMADWVICDMLGCAAYLQYRLHVEPGQSTEADLAQFRIDYEAILKVLDQKLI